MGSGETVWLAGFWRERERAFQMSDSRDQLRKRLGKKKSLIKKKKDVPKADGGSKMTENDDLC